ncbi:MAG: general secretion pathway protein GspB, partial [Rhodoferax sp.]|nr:general secretion pathway protein GspB [Rhodoferax sp.]
GGGAVALWWPEKSSLAVPLPVAGQASALASGAGSAPTTEPATSVAIAPAPAGDAPPLPLVPNTGLPVPTPPTPPTPTVAGAATAAAGAGAAGAGARAVPRVAAESAVRPPTPKKTPEYPNIETATLPAARASAVTAPTQPAKGPDAVSAAARSTASVPATPIPLLADLPEELRRQVPPIAVTGAVYSDNPAQRLLLMNGLVLTQGSNAAPDLTLEEIRERSAVFSFRGTRFRVAH